MALGLFHIVRCHALGYGYAAMKLIKIDRYLRQLVLSFVSDSDRCPKTEKNFFDYFFFVWRYWGVLTSFSVLLE
jgi:hypothetical protein